MKATNNNHLRHNFAIWVMGRRPGFFKPQRYMYRCLRCKWAFMVNDDHSGSVRVAPDEVGALTPSETLRRLTSFECGPCPGYQTAIEQTEESNVIPMRRENRTARAAGNARTG
jgi:hypothetical protein